MILREREFTKLDYNLKPSDKLAHLAGHKNTIHFLPPISTLLTFIKNHMRTNTGEKPNHCNFHEKRFSQLSHLTTHMPDRNHINATFLHMRFLLSNI